MNWESGYSWLRPAVLVRNLHSPAPCSFHHSGYQMTKQITPQRRGPKPDPDTRANLLWAGTKLFHLSGFHATGINEIVERANVPKGSFYNHFDSKETFGAEVVDYYSDRNLRSLRLALQHSELSPLTRLQEHFEQAARHIRDSGYVRGCMLGNLSLELADHSELVRTRLARHFNTWAGLLETCISEAQRGGEVSNEIPAATLAQFTLNSWEGAILRARSEKSDAPFQQFNEIILSKILS